jgi:hypothetical protein
MNRPIDSLGAEPLPPMGKGRVGVASPEERHTSLTFTPTQPSPIEGEGFGPLQ